jgi:hypothetical protein
VGSYCDDQAIVAMAGYHGEGRNVMKMTIASVLVAVLVLAVPMPSFAKADCRKDISEFDAAVKTTKATKADVVKATKLRDEANKDCMATGGSPTGDANMQQALKLIGAR